MRVQYFGTRLFCAGSGDVTGEIIMKYIEEQSKEPDDGEFMVDKEHQ